MMTTAWPAARHSQAHTHTHTVVMLLPHPIGLFLGNEAVFNRLQNGGFMGSLHGRLHIFQRHT